MFRTARRICVLVALTLTLALAGPSRADAAQRMGPAELWRWVESLWQDGIGIFARQERPAPASSGTKPGTPGLLEKNCTSLDPNGHCLNAPNAGGSSPGLGG